MYILNSIVYLIAILNFSQAQCGRRLIEHSEGLILNGFTTKPGDWPWHGAIYKSTDQQWQFTCGGSLITENYLLTAAHCVHEHGRVVGPERFYVELGRYDLRTSTSNQQNFQVTMVRPHTQYSEAQFNNDIAIIGLSPSATYTLFVQPICLWNDPDPFLSIENKVGTVIGWGITASGKIANTIQASDIPILSHQQCLQSDRGFFSQLTSGNFCAGYKNGTTICKGDSGGSLSLSDNGIYRIRGIVSYYQSNLNYIGCNPEQYVVFTDVAAYVHWINKMTGLGTVTNEVTRPVVEQNILPDIGPNIGVDEIVRTITAPTDFTITKEQPFTYPIYGSSWSSWFQENTAFEYHTYQETSNGRTVSSISSSQPETMFKIQTPFNYLVRTYSYGRK